MVAISTGFTNPTSAIIIDPSLVTIITYIEKKTNIKVFSCDLSDLAKVLLNQGLNKSDKFRIDVHAKDVKQSFDFGTLDSPLKTKDIQLKGFPERGKLHWRVLVLDASSKKIEYLAYTAKEPRAYDAEAPDTEALLLFETADLDVLWCMHMEEGEEPIVYITNKVEEMTAFLGDVNDMLKRNLVAGPAIIEALIHVVNNPSDDEGDWQLKYYSWIELQGYDLDKFKDLKDEDSYHIRDEVTDMIDSFYKKIKVIENINNSGDK
ncbi:hypothetical protein N8791_06320 [Gammaproteobacteria bacterium]|nr:hypothetical protein [Gammaproteobacteria bacterium]